MRAGIFAAALLLCAGQAWADEPSDWVKCDGYARPEGAGTTAARVVAVISTMGLFGLPESARYAPAARGQDGVDACTRALDTGGAENFPARRVSMLQARALHQVEANQLDAALEDLRAASTAAEGQSTEAWFQRSLGVSATLLEASILAKRGDQQRAEELALAAADTRAYSSTITGLAVLIFAVSPEVSEPEQRLLDRMVRFNPTMGPTRARLLEWGDDVNLAADENDRQLALQRGARDRGEITSAPVGFIARAALSSMRAGRTERASALVGELRAALAEPMVATPTPAARPAEVQRAMDAVRFAAGQRQEATRLMPLIQAFELINAGDAQAAFATFTVGRIPIEAATFDLLERLAAAPALARQAPGIREYLASGRRDERQRRSDAIRITEFAESLPPLEQVGGGNRFRSQGWGANGYEDRATAGGRIIEFSGGTTITTTEELALLRAAQLARDNNMTGFVMRSREDFQRYYVTTYAGTETSRAPSGFETRINVAFVDAANPPPEYAGVVVDADEVWTALSPIFNPPRSRR